MNTRIRTYRKQLLKYFAGLFTFFTLILVAYQFRLERNYKTQLLETRLSCYADIISHIDDYDQTRTLVPPEVRVTVIERNGNVTYDSVGDTEMLDNHFMRPEVQSALKKTEAFSIRESESIGIPYFYYAKCFHDRIIRLALPYNSGVRNYFRPDTFFLLFVLLLFTMALFSIFFMSDKLGEGISRLYKLAEDAANGRVDYANTKFPDSELGDIGRRILESFHRLEESNEKIALEKERLLLHIHYYDEGIALFSPARRKVYSNSKFIQYVNAILAQPTPDIDDIWDSDKFAPLKKFLQKNTFANNGQAPVFLFKINSGGHIYGVQMLIYPDNGFEITINDSTNQEKNRLDKHQMTNNIAHELRTPVSSIRGYLETLTSMDNIPQEKARTFIERAYVQTLRLSDIIRDIALITKIEEAPEQLQKEKIYLKSMSDEVFEEFRNQIEDKNIKVENLLDEKLYINGNHALIHAILRNLVENSIKYGGDGITIHIECYAESDGYCHFAYYDTGKGVSEEYLSKIFERFYRISEGRTRDAGGSGLGLSIVRNAILFHNGDVRAVNREQGGLEFIFSLSK